MPLTEILMITVIISIHRGLKIKPQEIETTRHHDTRAAYGEPPAALLNTHKYTKDFCDNIT